MCFSIMMMPLLMEWQLRAVTKNAELRQLSDLIRQHGRGHCHAPECQAQQQGEQNQRPEDHEVSRAVHARMHVVGILYSPPFDQTDFTRNRT